MSTKVILHVTLDDATPTGNDIANAVRRALTTQNLKDAPITVPIVSKGVSVRTRAVTTKPKTPKVNAIREFAIQQGLAKPGRGRLSKEAHAAWLTHQQ